MSPYRNFLLFIFFFFCSLPLIKSQQVAFFSGHVENTKGKLIKNARVEVLSKNVSLFDVKDGKFSLQFAKNGIPVAVRIAYQAKGYQTKIMYYEFVPGMLMQSVIVLIKGKDSEIKIQELQMLRATNGVYPE